MCIETKAFEIMHFSPFFEVVQDTYNWSFKIIAEGAFIEKIEAFFSNFWCIINFQDGIDEHKVDYLPLRSCLAIYHAFHSRLCVCISNGPWEGDILFFTNFINLNFTIVSIHERYNIVLPKGKQMISVKSTCNGFSALKFLFNRLCVL